MLSSLDIGSPFHIGERRVQEALHVREQIEPFARRVVRPYLPDEHRAFYAQLAFVVMAARDDAGRPWATLLCNPPGFIASADSGHLQIGALPAPGDALAGALEPGCDVGLLGIELHTRRRNRVNGRVAARAPGRFELAVDQAYGNCPQYISERKWRWVGHSNETAEAQRTSKLTAQHQALIARSDTFFIATGHREDGENAAFGMDASHRGGPKGFVTVDADDQLSFPDYAGNNHFNTIGNLVEDPRAGLVFVDFESGDLLQLTGRMELDWRPGEEQASAGAMRILHLEIESVVLQPGVLSLRFDRPGREDILELSVVERVRESDDVTSFLFAAMDGNLLPGFEPGQHLPIELSLPQRPAPVDRTYTLSSAPNASLYRISVKREARGLVSRYLHDELKVGDTIAARAPRGEFVLPDEIERRVVLLSAGIGITPMVPMLHALAQRPEVPTLFVHGTRGARFPLSRDVAEIAASAPNIRIHIAHSGGAKDVPEGDGHSKGRIDGGLIASLVPQLDADFYLCGPVPFLASLLSELSERGVPAGRIHYESFGPKATGEPQQGDES